MVRSGYGVVVVFINTLLYVTAHAAGGRIVMPWLCLERCSPHNVPAEIAETLAHKGYMNHVSFEDWKLGTHADLIKLDMTQVNGQFVSAGYATHPMLTSANILDMRLVFKTSDAFIAEAVTNAVKFGYAGYDLDMEPEHDVIAADAEPYEQFIDKFAKALHIKNKTLMVDIASWSPLWNFTRLAKTAVDRIHTMDTYTASWDSWQALFQKAVNQIGLAKLGVGLMSVNPSTGHAWTDNELKLRFDAITKSGVKEVDVWDIPISDRMWGYLGRWYNGTYVVE